jgi:hypothetical protein
MKKILLILLPISLFVFSCEINDAGGDTIINSNEGVQLKWIGQDGSQGSIFYKSSIPSVPSNWDIQAYINNNWVSDVWQFQYECVEIELFQSLGYFNYRLKGDDTTYVFTRDISELWGWEEEITIEQIP